MVGSCEQSNGPSGYIEDGVFLYQMNVRGCIQKFPARVITK
jgi:hypothetical protein